MLVRTAPSNLRSRTFGFSGPSCLSSSSQKRKATRSCGGACCSAVDSQSRRFRSQGTAGIPNEKRKGRNMSGRRLCNDSADDSQRLGRLAIGLVAVWAGSGCHAGNAYISGPFFLDLRGIQDSRLWQTPWGKPWSIQRRSRIEFIATSIEVSSD